MQGSAGRQRARAGDEVAARGTTRVDAVVIGAGFGGIYALHRLRRAGLSVLAFEAGDGPGGTWYWNRYPGARVDIESMVYSYSFDEELEQEWHWPEHFSPQADLERYANHVVDRFDLRRDIRFGTRVERLRFDDATNRWHVTTSSGDHGAGEYVAKYVVSATGSLHAANVPDIEGAETFEGASFHTAAWPREPVDLRGKAVGVIGTGATGIQIIPVIAETAGHLHVFQRTANFSIPSQNTPLDPEYERRYKASYRNLREMMRHTESAAVLTGRVDRSILATPPDERERILEEAWSSRSGFKFIMAFSDVRTNPEANEIMAEYVRRKIRSVVKDPATAELLCPSTHPIGTKRICIDTGYFETFNRDNVTLVDVRTNPIVRLTPRGLQTTAAEYPLDVLIYATGFDAMTGSMTRIETVGVGGTTLREKWVDGPTTYLGMLVAGFPNLFMIHGPGSPSVLAQMIMGAEWQADWIAGLIDHMEAHGLERVDTAPEWEQQWTAELQAAVDKTLFTRADSWYLGANIPGKPRVFMVWILGFEEYTKRCERAVADGFEGMLLS